MKKTLPRLNPNQEANIFAVIDDESMKKIVDADKKLFSNTIKKNTVNTTSTVTNFFESYKVDTIEIFTQISNSIENLVNIIAQGNKDLIEKLTKIEIDKDKEDKNRRPQEEEDKEEASSAKRRSGFLSNVFDKLKPGGVIFNKQNLEDPSNMSDTLIGAALGTGLGSTISKFIRSPIKGTFKLAKNPVALSIATILGGAIQSIEQGNWLSEYTNSSETQSAFAAFLAGSPKETGMEKLMQFGGMIGTGVMVGSRFGMPGMIAGALLGTGATIASRAIGPEVIADYLKIGTESFIGFFQATGLMDIDKTLIEAVKTKTKLHIETLEAQLNEESTKLQEATDKKKEAEAAGDTSLAESLQKQIDIIQANRGAIISNIERENAYLEQQEEKIKMADLKISERITQWFSNLDLPFTDKKLGDMPGSEFIGKVYRDAIEPTDSIEKLNKQIKNGEKLELPSAKNDGKVIMDWFTSLFKLPTAESFPKPAYAPLSYSAPSLDNTNVNKIMKNIYTEKVKPEGVKFKHASDAKSSEPISIGLVGGTNLNTNNTTVNNSSVNRQTVISRPNSTSSPTFGGYNRKGGF